MSARDELARVLHGSLCCEDWADIEHTNIVPDYYEMADAVLSEWLPTLADDEALIRDINLGATGRWRLFSGDVPGEIRSTLTRLAATLSPTSPPPVRSRAAGEHVDRPGAVGSATGRSASQT